MKMTLEQVVTILESEQTKATVEHRPDIYLAYQIAIEAVEREQGYRRTHGGREFMLLSGETKE